MTSADAMLSPVLVRAIIQGQEITATLALAAAQLADGENDAARSTLIRVGELSQAALATLYALTQPDVTLSGPPASP